MEVEVNPWKRVIHAHDCQQCDCCDDLICWYCKDHYAECNCPGPTQDEMEYNSTGTLARRRSDEEAS